MSDPDFNPNVASVVFDFETDTLSQHSKSRPQGHHLGRQLRPLSRHLGVFNGCVLG